MAILPKSEEAKCFIVTGEWKIEYPRQPEMIKFPFLLEMMKKELDVFLVINQVLSINVSNATSILHSLSHLKYFTEMIIAKIVVLLSIFHMDLKCGCLKNCIKTQIISS